MSEFTITKTDALRTSLDKAGVAAGGAQAIHRALSIVRIMSSAPHNGMKLVDIAEASNRFSR